MKQKNRYEIRRATTKRERQQGRGYIVWDRHESKPVATYSLLVLAEEQRQYLEFKHREKTGTVKR